MLRNKQKHTTIHILQAFIIHVHGSYILFTIYNFYFPARMSVGRTGTPPLPPCLYLFIILVIIWSGFVVFGKTIQFNSIQFNSIYTKAENLYANSGMYVFPCIAINKGVQKFTHVLVYTLKLVYIVHSELLGTL